LASVARAAEVSRTEIPSEFLRRVKRARMASLAGKGNPGREDARMELPDLLEVV
jgi:hypothetical protein